ncbi:MAG: hypothetical protein IJ728_05500, partial [Selenomonadaceae bacterium]|nr:hypothetical protein [Selenomonadaceae bacterium]
FTTMVQEVDRWLLGASGRNGGVFIFGKFKVYYSNILKRYNADQFIAVMESIFNPGKSGPVDLIDEMTVIQTFKEMKTKSDKKFNEYYRLMFWLLFAAAVNDEIYNNELPSIADFAYCLEFNEKMMGDWCCVVDYLLSGNHLNEESDLPLESPEGRAFFLHKN